MKAIKLLLISFLVVCVSTTNVVADKKSDKCVINQAYPQAKAEVLATFGAIAESIILGAGHGKDGPYMDQLISFHAYGPKFTEFNNGALWNSAQNEAYERTLFGVWLEPWNDSVNKFEPVPKTLEVAVYCGNVANLTFISNFVLTFVGDAEPTTINNLITLLFVKTKDGWKMVHEHHSPATLP